MSLTNPYNVPDQPVVDTSLEKMERLANEIDNISSDEYLGLLKKALGSSKISGYNQFVIEYMTEQWPEKIIELAETEHADGVRQWAESISDVNAKVTEVYLEE